MPEKESIFNFIVDCLKVAGSPYNIINDELIMAQCQVNVPASFFRPARIQTLNLQMVCSPGLLEKYPGSELVSSGSYRLQWFIDGIKQRGLITRLTFPYEIEPRKLEREINALLPDKPDFYYKQPSFTYYPNLMVNFKATFETDEKEEELYSFCIDLVTGAISENLFQDLSGKKLSPYLPKKNLEKRKIPYREGYEALLNHLKWLLKNHDPKWVNEARLRWEEEVDYLEDYYRGNQEEDSEQVFYRRVAEVYRKFRPVIRVHLINAAILYLPLVKYSLEPLPGRQPLPPIIYDPVRKKLKG